jgi:hypothetical protein
MCITVYGASQATAMPATHQSGVQTESYLLRSGSNRATLRRPLRARLDQPVAHHPGFQEPPDQLQHPYIADLPRHPRHQHVVVDLIEELLQIDVHHPAPSFTDVSLCLANRLMSTTTRTKAVA